MKNIYTEEINSTGTINLVKFLSDLSIVRVSLEPENDLHNYISKLDEDVNRLIKLIKFQDKEGAIKQWQIIFTDLNGLPESYFSSLDTACKNNQELIDKFKLDPKIEKELLGIVANSGGTLNI